MGDPRWKTAASTSSLSRRGRGSTDTGFGVTLYFKLSREQARELAAALLGHAG